jgi:hypothetical protein
LPQDRQCFSGWILGFRDGPPYHDVGGSGCDGLGWRDDANLISDICSGGAYAWGDDREVVSKLGADGASFAG